MRAILFCALALAVLPAAAQGSWFDVNWDHRRLITVASDSVGTGVPSAGELEASRRTYVQDQALIGFPVLLSDLPSAVYDSAKTDGSDLRFTMRNGIGRAYHEIVYYNAAAESCQIWVRLGTLTPGFNKFWVYYGNVNATMPSVAEQRAAWSDYEMVYHYDNNPALGRLIDSSPNGWDAQCTAAGAQVWNHTDRVTGKVQRGWHYNQNVVTTIRGPVIPEKDWSVFAWCNPDTFGTDLLMHGKPCYFHLAVGASDASHAPQYKNSYCGSVSNGVDYRFPAITEQDAFHHYTFSATEADSMVTLFFDGRPKAVAAFTATGERMAPHGIDSMQEQLGIGSCQYPQDGTGFNTDSMHGIVDEYHVRTGLLTDQFYRTVFRAQATQSTFVSFGSEEDF